MLPLNTHVTLVTIPAIGHVIPILELAKRIVAFDSFQVSLLVLCTDASPAQSQILRSVTLPEGLEIVEIPSVDISSYVSDDAHPLSRVSAIVRESLPNIESFIVNISRPTVLMVDMFATTSLDIAAENICSKYIFVATNATFLAFMLYFPILDQEVDGEFTHLAGPVQIPGCNPIQVEDLVDTVLKRSSKEYEWFLYHASRLPLASGILVNTCEDLERMSLEALRECPILRQIPTPTVHAVGPIINHLQKPSEEEDCMTWLAMQPDNSVLFVSFGSGGTLPTEQITELAWGLELSKQRFIWVVRKPNDSKTAGTFFSVGGEQSFQFEYLPDGFMKRVKGVGLLVPSWALQDDARTLVQELGVAVWPKVHYTEKGSIVKREEIDRVVRLVMEDKEGHPLRSRVNELKYNVLRALDRDDGLSHSSLSQVLEKWKSDCPCNTSITRTEDNACKE